ncbi:hypothetical protein CAUPRSCDRAFT_12772 [Caulochytrium protostelioides]|uniref:Uncharacterized protein n=1 Tax=Caulochytrium protostelioides TaxID=1555241 RepID=A0A4P9WVW1_9FUNG|nr:hypothetical protein CAUPRSCDRAFT_12772 [Caulochytrium protostelioides]
MGSAGLRVGAAITVALERAERRLHQTQPAVGHRMEDVPLPDRERERRHALPLIPVAQLGLVGGSRPAGAGAGAAVAAVATAVLRGRRVPGVGGAVDNERVEIRAHVVGIRGRRAVAFPRVGIRAEDVGRGHERRQNAVDVVRQVVRDRDE